MDRYQAPFKLQDTNVYDLYFHGEHDEFLTAACGNIYIHGCDKMKFVEYEFQTTLSTSSSSSSSSGGGGGERPKVEVDYSTLKKDRYYKTGPIRYAFERNVTQPVINKQIEESEICIEVEGAADDASDSDDEQQTMTLYDISRGPKYPPMKLMDCGKTKTYAFTRNGLYFAHISMDEDGDGREDPILEIDRLYTWRQLHWERRRDVMMFLAGYGLLHIFREKKANGYHEHSLLIAEEGFDDEFSKESSIVQTLFKVLQCPNVLQQIVLYV
jgi:hypothetical protein